MSVSQPCDEFVPFAIDCSPEYTSHEQSNNTDLYIGDAIESERTASEGVGTDEGGTVGQILREQRRLAEPIEDNVAAVAFGSEDILSREQLRFSSDDDMPHFQLGRVFGATNITVHILFLHLPLAPGRDRFISITQAQLARWTDRVMHPAIWRFYPVYHT